MGVEEFFNAIRERCSSEAEYAVEVIKARGFLLEDEKLALSDNSHRWDEEFLRRILRAENIGDVNDRNITILRPENIENIFSMEYVGGSESFGTGEWWQLFVHNSYAPKVPISLLEPFVARYIKAISACGVRTCGSCDGNRPNQNAIVAEFDSHPNMLWHELIYKRCLSSTCKLRWLYVRYCNRIRFSERNKWKVYIEVNRVAEYLYNNRIILRGIRRKACDGISNSMANHLPTAELDQIFLDRANELFDSCDLMMPPVDLALV